MTITIATYADLHGTLPEPVECDLAIIAGDICPDLEKDAIKQYAWMVTNYLPWLNNFERICWVAGNHDYICSRHELLYPIISKPNQYYLECTAAQPFTCDPISGKENFNKGFEEFSHLSIWGSPYSLPYGTYNFMEDESFIGRKLEDPKARMSDIIISHTPPYGTRDLAPRQEPPFYEHVGSSALRWFINKYNPALLVCGHIHEGRGVYKVGKTLVVNAAMTTGSPSKDLVETPLIIKINTSYRGFVAFEY